MQALYNNTQTKFITLSAQPVEKINAALQLTAVSIDSISNYFPQIHIDIKSGNLETDKQVYLFQKNDGVAALRNDTLYIFK
jgi:predicted membrane GTPase involved in stress response